MAGGPSKIEKDAAFLGSMDETTASSTVTSGALDLHRSNLLRLQVDEMIEECHLDLSQVNWATIAHSYMENVIATIQTVKLSNVSLKLAKSGKSCKISLNDDNNNNENSDNLSVEPFGLTKIPIGWTKASGNARILPTFTLQVQIPSSVFATKDYLNYRYFEKRNFIMEQVAKQLHKSKKKLGKIEYTFQQPQKQPCLMLTPPPLLFAKSNNKKPSSSSCKFRIQLLFGMQSIDWIPKLRLVPNRYNIKQQTESNNGEIDKTTVVLNQLYNHELLQDASHIFENEELTQFKDDYRNLERAFVMIKIWALQRGLWRNHDGWTDTNVALFLLYVLRTNKVNSRMTPIQVFTVVLQTWATTNWLGENQQDKDSNNNMERRAAPTEGHVQQQSTKRTVLVLPLQDCTESQTIQQSKLNAIYKQQTKDAPLTDHDPSTLMALYSSTKAYTLGPVFLDPTMTFNYLGGVSPNFMKLLQLHAQKSIHQLHGSKSAFQNLFMKQTRFWNQWDIYVEIPITKSNNNNWEVYTRNVVATLSLALGNRIQGLRILSTGNGDIFKDGRVNNNNIMNNNYNNNSDQIPTIFVGDKAKKFIDNKYYQSPTGTKSIVVGLAMNPATCQRVVDRGPPAEHVKQVQEFVSLWGSKATLRRFKDGAIVQAVIWNETQDLIGTFQNDDSIQGGIIQRIIKHIIKLHFTQEPIKFALPGLPSLVDGVWTNDKAMSPFCDPIMAHRNVMRAYDSLAEFLRTNSQLSPGGGKSRLGLPLTIDSVEPLSPCLRYADLFPPLPHTQLGGPAGITSALSSKKVAGAVVSDPILIQIRFGASSKWPTDFKAIGAAKTAMLIQLANGIDAMGENGFVGRINVTPHYADVAYKGYCFRILVRADPEIKMLQSLVQPSPLAAARLQELTRRHVFSAKHHSIVHAVYTLHPAAGTVVRLATRWIASHLLSDLIPLEAIELMVVKVFSSYDDKDGTTWFAPGCVASGFIRFLELLAAHDWAREPLIVNPRGHIDEVEYDDIVAQFEKTRGPNYDVGPPMYIISPNDRQTMDDTAAVVGMQQQNDTTKYVWSPTIPSPEWVVLTRAASLAKRSHAFLVDCIKRFDDKNAWSAVFLETAASFKSYSILLRVDTNFVFDSNSSSNANKLTVATSKDSDVLESAYTRSMKARYTGPKPLRRNIYRNLQVSQNDDTVEEDDDDDDDNINNDNSSKSDNDSILMCWNPIQSAVCELRQRYGRFALFFYNQLASEVIGVLWRPNIFKPQQFSVMTAEHVCPLENSSNNNWKYDSLVARNVDDILREMSQIYQNIVTTVKVFDDKSILPKRKRKSDMISNEQENDNDNEKEEENNSDEESDATSSSASSSSTK